MTARPLPSAQLSNRLSFFELTMQLIDLILRQVLELQGTMNEACGFLKEPFFKIAFGKHDQAFQ